MRKFIDSTGDTWKVDITVGTMLDVHSALGYDLSESIETIPSGLVGQVALLAVLCSEQIEQRGLTERDFALRLSGEAFADATDCLMRELADFFTHHKPALGEILRQCLDKDKARQAAMVALASKVCSSPSTNWRELQESTPET